MHIVYHHRTAGRGAEGNHIMALVKALEGAGHTVSIVSPPGVDPRQTAGQVPLDKGAGRQQGLNRVWQWISKHAPQVLFEFAELGYNGYAALRVALAILRERPDAYYERYAFFVFMGVFTAKLLGRPVLLEVNEITGITRARGQVLVPVAAAIERMVFRNADAIFTVSSFLRDEVIRRGASPSAVQLMPNAIDPRRFDLEGRRGRVRRQFGIENAVVAGFVGWFDHWDRLELLIDATAVIVKSRPEFRLLLVGDGPVMPLLLSRVAEHGLGDSVIFTGAVPRENVPEYIDAMDMCVMADSNPYGSPMVLFEFMALAKAVVAPDLAPVRDVVTHGETGLIVQPGNAEEITAAVERLIAEPEFRRAVGARARSYVFEHHTWKANGLRVAALARPQLEEAVAVGSKA